MNLILQKNKYKSLIVILLALNKLVILLTSNKSVTDKKILSVILMNLNKTENPSYFGKFEEDKNVISYCKFYLKWIPINWTFKVSP